MSHPFKFIITFIFVSTFSFTLSAQTFLEVVKLFQEELNEHYMNPEKSPLNPKEIKSFKSHSFYEPNIDYKITATFTPAKAKTVKMETSTDRIADYAVYGKATFTLNEIEYSLNLYYPTSENRDNVKELFLPFKDYTNGNETYGGGRYMDVELPENGKVIIDFNQSYNPYCAYSHNYSCPVPPKENHLEVEIPVGIKLGSH